MNKRVGIAALLLALLLLGPTPLQAQLLTLVEVHDDNESPETNGTTEQTHLDGPLAEAMPPLVFSPDGKADAT